MLGRGMASYLRFVWRSSRVVMEPANLYDLAEVQLPMILTFWHGQHFLTPFLVKPHHRAKVMICQSGPLLAGGERALQHEALTIAMAR